MLNIVRKTAKKGNTIPVFVLVLLLFYPKTAHSSEIDITAGCMHACFTVVPSVQLSNDRVALTSNQVETVLREAGWPESEIRVAKIIVLRESSNIPAASGDGGSAKGLFQIHWDYDLDYGSCPIEDGYFWGWYNWARYCLGERMPNKPFDPLTNARLAKIIFDNSGWGPWTTAEKAHEDAAVQLE